MQRATITLFLTDDLKVAIRIAAAEVGVSVSEYMRVAAYKQLRKTGKLLRKPEQVLEGQAELELRA
jgi:uncharacterized protein (DUF1778 family)